MKQLITLIALVIMVLLLPAHSHAVPFTAILDGLSENPANASLGTGFATVDLDNIAHTLSVSVSFSGLSGTTTAAHIHCCVSAPGNAGVATMMPSFSGFPLGVSSGTYTSVFYTILASTFNGSFVTANGGTAAGAEAALLAGLLAGDAYLNIHTNAFPGGEIRGFLHSESSSVPEPSTMLLLGSGLAGFVALRRKFTSV
jgi:hypothetical protein